MAALALPQPHQLTYLDAPVIPDAEVKRLAVWLNRLRYTDALLAGSFRVERGSYQQISDVENDQADDGTLMTGSYVEYVVFVAGRLSGAVEARMDDGTKVLDLHVRLARYLLAAGWRLDATTLVEGGAISSPGMRLDRVKRLLKEDKHG